jgi:hypothetical protein
LADFAECITFPFLAAFDLEVTASDVKAKNIKRVSYIGLSKWAMEKVAKLYLHYKNLQDIYTDGTLEAILGVSFAISDDVLSDSRGLGIFYSDQTQI